MSMPIKEYLKHRRAADTPEGDFVADALRDPDFPDAKSWDELEGYLRRRNACPEAITAGRVVWRQYRAACAG